MAYGGEQLLDVQEWRGRAGADDEPYEAVLNRILTLRFQIAASNQMAAADTTTETANTAKLTIPAGTLQKGDRIRCRFFGNVTSQNSTDTLTLALKLGGLSGVTLATVTAFDAASNDKVEGEADVWFEVVGAASTAKFHSRGKTWRTGATSDNRTFVIDNTSLSTLADQDIVVTEDWSVNNASNRFKLFELSAEVFRTRQAWA